LKSPNYRWILQSKTFNFLQSTQLFCAVKSNLQTPPIYLHSIYCFNKSMETILITNLLLEKSLVHLPNLVIKFLASLLGIIDIFLGGNSHYLLISVSTNFYFIFLFFLLLVFFTFCLFLLLVFFTFCFNFRVRIIFIPIF